MRFEGKVNQRREVDWQSYWEDRDKRSFRISTPSEYETGGTYSTAEVVGRFGHDFCHGVNPLHINEYENEPEVTAEIDLSYALIERLERDGQTEPEYLAYLRSLIDSSWKQGRIGNDAQPRLFKLPHEDRFARG